MTDGNVCVAYVRCKEGCQVSSVCCRLHWIHWTEDSTHSQHLQHHHHLLAFVLPTLAAAILHVTMYTSKLHALTTSLMLQHLHKQHATLDDYYFIS